MTADGGFVARPCAFADIEPLREAYRAEANCQIVHDSILPRGLADAYLLHRESEVMGYGGVPSPCRRVLPRAPTG